MSKKIFTTFLIVFSSAFLCNAQWVTIPDPNFVSWLQTNYPSCMNGNLMDTTCSGIVNTIDIDCSGQNISDLTGIQYFNNISNLFCQNNNLTSLPTLPENLYYLECYNNLLTHFGKNGAY